MTQTQNKSAAVFCVSLSFHEKLLTSLSRFRFLFLRTQKLLIWRGVYSCTFQFVWSVKKFVGLLSKDC